MVPVRPQPTSVPTVRGLEPVELYAWHLPPVYAMVVRSGGGKLLESLEALAEVRTAVDVLAVSDDAFADMLAALRSELFAAVMADARGLSAAVLAALGGFDVEDLVACVAEEDAHVRSVADLLRVEHVGFRQVLHRVVCDRAADWHEVAMGRMLRGHADAFGRLLDVCGFDGAVSSSMLSEVDDSEADGVLFGVLVDRIVYGVQEAAVELVLSEVPAPPVLQRDRYSTRPRGGTEAS